MAKISLTCREESQGQESFGFLLLLTEHFAGGKVKVLTELFIHQPDHLSHGERCQHRTDADSPDMPQEKEGQRGRGDHTDGIKADFDFRIRDAGDLSQFPWKQVRGDNGETAAV